MDKLDSPCITKEELWSPIPHLLLFWDAAVLIFLVGLMGILVCLARTNGLDHDLPLDQVSHGAFSGSHS